MFSYKAKYMNVKRDLKNVSRNQIYASTAAEAAVGGRSKTRGSDRHAHQNGNQRRPRHTAANPGRRCRTIESTQNQSNQSNMTEHIELTRREYQQLLAAGAIPIIGDDDDESGDDDDDGGIISRIFGSGDGPGLKIVDSDGEVIAEDPEEIQLAANLLASQTESGVLETETHSKALLR